MAYQNEQRMHEIINFSKTLNLLKRLTHEEDWYTSPPSHRMEKWLKAQSILAGIKQCRDTLQGIPANELEVSFGHQSSSFHEDLTNTLDSLEQVVSKADQDLKPQARRSNGILASLPIPNATVDVTSEPQQELKDVDNTVSPADNTNLHLPIDLLLEPGSALAEPVSRTSLPTRDFASTSIPKSVPAPRVQVQDQATNGMSGFLQTSTALQEDLSTQLAEMASQLKANAVHFSETLAKDQNIVRETEEKLSENYDSLSKERTRLKDHSAKSRGTSCLVFLSIIVVIVGFFLTFFVIRIT